VLKIRAREVKVEGQDCRLQSQTAQVEKKITIDCDKLKGGVREDEK